MHLWYSIFVIILVSLFSLIVFMKQPFCFLMLVALGVYREFVHLQEKSLHCTAR